MLSVTATAHKWRGPITEDCNHGHAAEQSAGGWPSSVLTVLTVVTAVAVGALSADAEILGSLWTHAGRASGAGGCSGAAETPVKSSLVRLSGTSESVREASILRSTARIRPQTIGKDTSQHEME